MRKCPAGHFHQLGRNTPDACIFDQENKTEVQVALSMSAYARTIENFGYRCSDARDARYSPRWMTANRESEVRDTIVITPNTTVNRPGSTARPFWRCVPANNNAPSWRDNNNTKMEALMDQCSVFKGTRIVGQPSMCLIDESNHKTWAQATLLAAEYATVIEHNNYNCWFGEALSAGGKTMASPYLFMMIIAAVILVL